MRCSSAVLALGLCAALSAQAEDLGRFGPVYEIAEKDWLKHIEERLKAMEKSGEMTRMIEDKQKRMRAAAESPPAVDAVMPTSKPRTFYYDPSVTVDYNITGPDGEIIVPAGTTVNPLDVMKWPGKMLFIDAREERQVAYARQVRERDGTGVKIILVGGSPADLMRSWKARVYYDQAGALTRRLGITQVPAVVAQQGKRLRIDEVMAN